MEESQEDEGVGPITTTGKASAGAMADLHGVIAEYLTLRIRSGRPPDGLVNSAITFMKNNNITSDPATNEKLQGLAQSLKEKRSKKLTGRDMRELDSQVDSVFSNLMQ